MSTYENDLYPRSGDAITINGRAKITGTPTDADDLMDKSTTETAINDAVALAVSQIRAVSVTKRQTVFYGPVDANGAGNCLTKVGNDVKISATAVNVGMTWAAGIDTEGPVDRLYVYDADTTPGAWVGFTTDGTFYLYIDYNSGTPTYGTSTLRPIYQAKTPTTPSTGQFWFDINNYVAYVYSGSTWVATERLYVGEVFVTGSALSTVTTYAYNGRYNSDWFAVATSNTYVKYHNIGVGLTSGLSITHLFSLDSDGASNTIAQTFYIDTDNVACGRRYSIAVNNGHLQHTYDIPARIQLYASSQRTSGYDCLIISRSF